jgi:hypothetical protein
MTWPIAKLYRRKPGQEKTIGDSNGERSCHPKKDGNIHPMRMRRCRDCGIACFFLFKLPTFQFSDFQLLLDTGASESLTNFPVPFPILVLGTPEIHLETGVPEYLDLAGVCRFLLLLFFRAFDEAQSAEFSAHPYFFLLTWIDFDSCRSDFQECLDSPNDDYRAQQIEFMNSNVAVFSR